MKTARSVLVGLIVILAGPASVKADLTLYEPNLVPVLRGSGFQSYPLAVDSSGDVYTVTGTSPSDQLLEVTASGQVLTVNPAVGGDIGVFGKLDFAFGGNLFATSFGGIIEFSLPSGSSSMFYSGSQDGDAALAYDPSRQVLWVSNSGPTWNNIIALNASGKIVETIQNVSYGGYGMALDKSGNLILMTANGIIDSINPNTQVVTQIANLTSVLPNADIRSLAINPNTGDLFFSNQYSGPNPSLEAQNGLYKINPDGTGLTLIASGFSDQMTFGASSLGNGETSIYLGDPGNYQLFELQSVPEPSSLLMAVTGALALLGYGYWRTSGERS